MDAALNRRRLLQTGLLATAAVSFGPGFWRNAYGASAQVGAGPYGPLGAPDANGIRLPAGFKSRELLRAGQVVPGTAYVFPAAPDAQAAFATPDGGWILVTNSEIGGGGGGVSATRFNAAGDIVSAYRILGGTSTNCAGGPTPWGTWLTCEEVDDGFTWECDPTGSKPGIKHAALGKFRHEAACVDPTAQVVYETEDVGDGGLYRFTPTAYPDLSAGLLEIACDGGGGTVIWKPVPDPQGGAANPTRKQVPGSIPFARGEGMWFDAGIVYVATTNDDTIHAYDTVTKKLDILYRAADVPDTPLRGVDNVHVSRSGDVYVAEDSYTGDPDEMDICIISPEKQVSRFLKLTGDQHFKPVSSEVTGVCFDPSGTRLYLSSQRGFVTGVVYEITGPFRLTRPGMTATPTPTPPPTPAPSTGGNPSGGGPAPVVSGAPLGLDVASKITTSALTKNGLALALTLDGAARVRATLTITEPAAKGKRKTTTIATLDRKIDAGPELVRLKPTSAKLGRSLTARKRAITATLVVRVQATGSAERVLRRSVRLTPAPKPAAKKR